MPAIAEAVAALREFADHLASHPAFIVTVDWEVRGPAPAEVIAHYRANPGLLPKDLVDLYELMNGCDLNWAFRTHERLEDDDSYDFIDMWDGDMVGRLNLPRLTIDPDFRELRFGTDEQNGYTFFGPAAISLFLDQMQPEYGTWLVAYGPGGPHAPKPEHYEPYDLDYETEEAAHANARIEDYRLVYLIFKDEEHLLPGNLADYLRQGIAAGFVNDWPLAYQEQGEELPYKLEEFNEQQRRYQAALGA